MEVSKRDVHEDEKHRLPQNSYSTTTFPEAMACTKEDIAALVDKEKETRSDTALKQVENKPSKEQNRKGTEENKPNKEQNKKGTEENKPNKEQNKKGTDENKPGKGPVAAGKGGGSSSRDFAATRVDPSLPLCLVGEMVWASVSGKGSWWPAMVTYDPNQAVYFRFLKGGKFLEYHLQWFGQGALRSWVLASRMRKFISAQQYNISRRKTGQAALEEVREAAGMTLQERKARFIFNFGQPSPLPSLVQPAAAAAAARKKKAPESSSGSTDVQPVVATPLESPLLRPPPPPPTSLRDEEETTVVPAKHARSSSRRRDGSKRSCRVDNALLTTRSDGDSQEPMDAEEAAKLALDHAHSQDSPLSLRLPTPPYSSPPPHSECDTSLASSEGEGAAWMGVRKRPVARYPAGGGAGSGGGEDLKRPCISDDHHHHQQQQQQLGESTERSGSVEVEGSTEGGSLERGSTEGQSLERGPASTVAAAPPSLKEKRGVSSLLQSGQCSICEGAGAALLACGQCGQTAHPDCLGLVRLPAPPFLCDQCVVDGCTCFFCKSGQGELSACSHGSCLRRYHAECVRGREGFKFHHPHPQQQSPSFTCPLHACARCARSGPTGPNPPRAHLVSCSRCLLTLHNHNQCLVAGCEVVTRGAARTMLCYKHLARPAAGCKRKSNVPPTVNLDWCYACGSGGSLLCCDVCSSAFHAECIRDRQQEEESPLPGATTVSASSSDLLPGATVSAPSSDLLPGATVSAPSSDLLLGATVSAPLSDLLPATTVSAPSSVLLPGATVSAPSSVLLPGATVSAPSSVLLPGATVSAPSSDSWVCPDCSQYQMLTYGSLAWCKCGVHRFWPCEVVPPRLVPADVLRVKPMDGMFMVRFFGTGEHCWTHLGRCVPYHMDEESRPRVFDSTGSQKKKELLAKGLQEIAERAKSLSLTQKTSKKHRRLKTNKYLVPPPPRGDAMEMCTCSEARPCAEESSCVNRAVMIECSPTTCPLGEKCQNRRMQCLQKNKKTPAAVPFYTGARGWGLKASRDVQEDEFVVEYVGEVIDDAMCRQRLLEYSRDGKKCFYILSLIRGLYIDAAVRANEARFINHSCDPNLETQKWVVDQKTCIGLFALRDIASGEELTFDYQLDTLGHEKMKCFCGAANCSGFLGEKARQPSGSGSKTTSKDTKSTSKETKTTSKRSKTTSSGHKLTSNTSKGSSSGSKSLSSRRKSNGV